MSASKSLMKEKRPTIKEYYMYIVYMSIYVVYEGIMRVTVDV